MDTPGSDGAKCPHCGANLEWEPREDDRTPVDSRFDRANELLREAAREAGHKQLESDYHAERAHVAELEAELVKARAEVDSVKIENAKLKLALKKARGPQP